MNVISSSKYIFPDSSQNLRTTSRRCASKQKLYPVFTCHFIKVSKPVTARPSTMMSFDRSTQSKSWVFSEKNLRRCREKATNERLVSRNQNGEVRVRNFASGFRSSVAFSIQNHLPVQLENKEIQSNLLLSSQEQDTLVRFHANQISMLVGPDAILSTLVRSETVYATSIMIFRRFFLSNSVLDFSPRKMATASCFLASKLEESRLDVSLDLLNILSEVLPHFS